MYQKALRYVLNISGMLFSCIISCSLPSEYLQFNGSVYPEYNDIEAVTSASGDIQVTGGKAYSTYTVLETYHKDSYSHHFIAYGRGYLLDDTVFVADTPRVHICTLFNLIPNMIYSFNFQGDYPPNADIENHHVEGEFQTIPVK